MPTSSITKRFIIKDKKSLVKLGEILNSKPRRKIIASSKKYEEGKILLEQYCSNSEKIE